MTLEILSELTNLINIKRYIIVSSPQKAAFICDSIVIEFYLNKYFVLTIIINRFDIETLKSKIF